MRLWPVDPANPGEVLACAGLAHLAWRADRGAATGFVRARDGGVRFVAPDAVPLPDGAGAWPLERIEAPPHERLRFAGVTLDWWCPWGLNPQMKTWSGRQSAWTVHRERFTARSHPTPPCDWLRHRAPAAGGRLGLDPRGTWDALELGWSLSAHRSVRFAVRPWVELLASVGLQAVGLARARGGFRYRLWRVSPLPVARAAFAGAAPDIETLAAYHVRTAKSGANTVLRPAERLDHDTPEHADPMRSSVTPTDARTDGRFRHRPRRRCIHRPIASRRIRR